MQTTPPHHTPRGFRNNYPHPRLNKQSNWALLREFLRAKVQPVTLPVASNNPEDLRHNRIEPTLTWIGHDSFLLQIDGKNILTDPHFSARASPVQFAGPKRWMAPGLSLDALPPIDFVFISHDHYDHLDEISVREIARRHPQALFFVPLRVQCWFTQRGITRTVELDWWGQHLHDGFTAHAVPVQHFSGRTLGGRNSTLWCGWVLETPTRRVFFAGDSGYSTDFRDIGERFGSMDLSLIPIGAYEPRWFMQAMHVNPEEAVKIHQDLRSQLSVAMHWGTFRLTTEPMDEPPRRLAVALAQAQISSELFWVMQHGETRRLPWPFARARPVAPHPPRCDTTQRG